MTKQAVVVPEIIARILEEMRDAGGSLRMKSETRSMPDEEWSPENLLVTGVKLFSSLHHLHKKQAS